jgi:hypothetical protein
MNLSVSQRKTSSAGICVYFIDYPRVSIVTAELISSYNLLIRGTAIGGGSRDFSAYKKLSIALFLDKDGRQ